MHRFPSASRKGHAPSARGGGTGPFACSSAHSDGHSTGGRPVFVSWQHSAVPGHECFAHAASALRSTADVSFIAAFTYRRIVQPTDTGAKCVLHPGRLARTTCPRCGSFGCPECLPAPDVQCPTCQQLTGRGPFPFTRDAFSFDALFGFAFAKWKAEWVMLSVAFLVVIVAQWVGGLISNLLTMGITFAVTDRVDPLIGGVLRTTGAISNNVLGTAIAGVFQMGFAGIALDVLHGRRADVGKIVSQYRKLGRYLVHYGVTVAAVGAVVIAWFAATAAVALAASGMAFRLDGIDDALDRAAPAAIAVLGVSGLAFVPVGLFVWTHYVLGVNELVSTECGAFEAIRRAYQMTDGVRLRAMGYPFVAGVLMVAGVFACCVGLFPAAALAQLLTGALYLTLRGARNT